MSATIKEEESLAVRAVKDILSGAFGGVAQTLSGQPFDTVKVRLQATPHLYPGGVRQCVYMTMKEGPLAFYKGTLSPLIGSSIAVAIQFGTVEYCKRLFEGKDKGRKLKYWEHVVSGMAAGAANTVVVSPLELVRIRMQVQTNVPGQRPQYSGSIDCFNQTMRKYGLRGIYRGVGATLARESLGFGGFFTVYNVCVDLLSGPHRTVADLSPYEVLFCGSMAGFGFWIPVYFIDVIKTKMQADSFESPKYRSMIHCAKTTIAAEGIVGLYRGFWPCMFRSIPVNACTFLAFEMSMRVLGRS